ncbi:phosphohydrolase [Xylophilus sp. Kf1]|nr:phosphohydrolase [Xylophilus sp. Kf1]
MNLIPLRPESIKLGLPLPFSLRTDDGTLLARRGLVVSTRNQLEYLMARAGTLCIDIEESPEHQRAYMGQLDTLVREQKTIGEIAQAHITPKAATPVEAPREGPPDWLELQLRATQLLRHAEQPEFLPKVRRLHAELLHCSKHQPDATLFALIHFASRELAMYSATHALLVAVICSMAARDVLLWDEATVETVGLAALTMNISMTELQDQLAQQPGRPTEAQMALISVHAGTSVGMLETLGVTDAVWLDAVRRHHEPPSGKLSDMTAGDRVARLIERADIFAARLSPRVSRWAMPAAIAMRASYFDDQHRVDEAGASLITAMGGVYPPGSFVRLASSEVALVLRRGRTGTTPKVATVLNRQGMPVGEMSMRDTALATHKITASLPYREVKVQFSLEKMLALI